jgi:hypothetical protein
LKSLQFRNHAVLLGGFFMLHVLQAITIELQGFSCTVGNSTQHGMQHEKAAGQSRNGEVDRHRARPSTPAPLGCGGFRRVQLQVYRSGLDWLAGHIDADVPPPSTKHLAAEFAHRLVNEFSQRPPSTTFDGQVREIGTLLYQAVSGEEDVELKRQTDIALKSARKNTCIIVRGGFKGNESLQATIDGQTIFREPGEDELGFIHRAIEAARAARALPVIISEGPL